MAEGEHSLSRRVLTGRGVAALAEVSVEFVTICGACE
jgi:hypothetical protein